MIRKWIQRLDQFWDELYKPYPGAFDFWPQWVFQYCKKLPLGEATDSVYLKWKSEQHILTPK